MRSSMQITRLVWDEALTVLIKASPPSPLRIIDRVWSLFKSSFPRVLFFHFSFNDGDEQIVSKLNVCAMCLPESHVSPCAHSNCFVHLHMHRDEGDWELFSLSHQGRVWNLLRVSFLISLSVAGRLNYKELKLSFSINTKLWDQAIIRFRFICQALQARLSSASELRVGSFIIVYAGVELSKDCEIHAQQWSRL